MDNVSRYSSWETRLLELCLTNNNNNNNNNNNRDLSGFSIDQLLSSAFISGSCKRVTEATHLSIGDFYDNREPHFVKDSKMCGPAG